MKLGKKCLEEHEKGLKSWFIYFYFFCGFLFSLFLERPKSRLVERRAHRDAAGNYASGSSSYMLDLTMLHISKKQESAGSFELFAKGKKMRKRRKKKSSKQGLSGIIPVFIHPSDNLRTPTLSWDPGQHRVCVCACTMSWCRFAGRGFSAILYQGVSFLYSSAHQASKLAATPNTQPMKIKSTTNQIFETRSSLSLVPHLISISLLSGPQESTHPDNWFHSALPRPHRRPTSPLPWAQDFQLIC